jgi:hypothetical protein
MVPHMYPFFSYYRFHRKSRYFPKQFFRLCFSVLHDRKSDSGFRKIPCCNIDNDIRLSKRDCVWSVLLFFPDRNKNSTLQRMVFWFHVSDFSELRRMIRERSIFREKCFLWQIATIQWTMEPDWVVEHPNSVEEHNDNFSFFRCFPVFIYLSKKNCNKKTSNHIFSPENMSYLSFFVNSEKISIRIDRRKKTL